jgi:hypothetical protein
MRNQVATAFLVMVVSGCILLAGCGGTTARKLLSISVTPSAADAQNFPLGGVQFTATGTYSKSPTTAVLSTATWTSSNPAIAAPDNSGFTQCAPGVPPPMQPPPTGTVTITASAPVSTGSSVMVSGTATFTCP